MLRSLRIAVVAGAVAALAPAQGAVVGKSPNKQDPQPTADARAELKRELDELRQELKELKKALREQAGTAAKGEGRTLVERVKADLAERGLDDDAIEEIGSKVRNRVRQELDEHGVHVFEVGPHRFHVDVGDGEHSGVYRLKVGDGEVRDLQIDPKDFHFDFGDGETSGVIRVRVGDGETHEIEIDPDVHLRWNDEDGDHRIHVVGPDGAHQLFDLRGDGAKAKTKVKSKDKKKDKSDARSKGDQEKAKAKKEKKDKKAAKQKKDGDGECCCECSCCGQGGDRRIGFFTPNGGLLTTPPQGTVMGLPATGWTLRSIGGECAPSRATTRNLLSAPQGVYRVRTTPPAIHFRGLGTPQLGTPQKVREVAPKVRLRKVEPAQRKRLIGV